MQERVQKILAAAGVASRRAADDLVRAGRVTVNGVTARPGDRADVERDAIAVDGRTVEPEPTQFWIVHKPAGVLTTARDPHGRRTVIDLLPPGGPRLFPVGRLDADTEGLVLLTNDGETAHALLHPSFGSEREYLVTVRGRPEAATLRRLARGVPLDDGVTAPARVGRPRVDRCAGTATFRLTLTEGRRRQIRRACEALGHPVTRLVRVRLGPLELGRLASGAARPLRGAERRALRAHAYRLRERRVRTRRAPPARTRRGARGGRERP